MDRDAPVMPQDLLYGRVQASDHCRLTNPVLKFSLVILTLVVGTLFVGWRYPERGDASALEQYARAFDIVLRYNLLVVLIVFLDFRKPRLRYTLTFGILILVVWAALTSIDLDAKRKLVELFLSTPVAYLLEPLELLVLLTFLMGIPLIAVSSSRDVLVYIRLIPLLLGMFVLVVLIALVWRGVHTREAWPIMLAVVLCVAFATVAAIPVGRLMVRKVLFVMLLVITFVFYFLSQTLGPRLPIAARGALSRFRLTKDRGTMARYSEFGRTFTKLLGMQLTALVDSALSLMRERDIWNIKLRDPITWSGETEDVVAVLLIAFACVAGLSDLFVFAKEAALRIVLA